MQRCVLRILAILVGLLLLVFLTATMEDRIEQTPLPPTMCTGQVPLTAHGELTWAEHRQWLETPVHFMQQRIRSQWDQSYVLVNARTGAAYRWGVEEVDGGSGRVRFGVLTRWAWTHPAWSSEPWVLMYGC